MSDDRSRPTAVRIWDLPTRVFHWVLAASVVASVVSAKIGGNAMAWHFRLGYLAMALLAFRLLWGVVGGRWSRFAAFAYGPAAVLRFLRGQAGPHDRFEVGHNPLGALSVFALLALLIAQVATGLVADDEIANVGPLNRFVSGATASLATGWHHRWGQGLLLALLGLHVAAILWYRFGKGVDLIGPMVGGDKMLPAATPASRDDLGTRLLAIALVALCAGAAALLARWAG
jgi:cytochrome b